MGAISGVAQSRTRLKRLSSSRGNINDTTTLEKSLVLSQNVKHIVRISAIPLLDIYPREL